MTFRWAVAALAVVLSAACGSTAAGAEPVGVPAVGAPCADELSGVRTVLPDLSFATCSGGVWQAVAVSVEPSDRWLSYGDGVTLHGQGRRNPEMLAGSWTGTPLSDDGTCAVEQTVVTDAGVGEPVTTAGVPGEPLPFEVDEVAFAVVLTGDCVWQRAL